MTRDISRTVIRITWVLNALAAFYLLNTEKLLSFKKTMTLKFSEVKNRAAIADAQLCHKTCLLFIKI